MKEQEGFLQLPMIYKWKKELSLYLELMDLKEKFQINIIIYINFVNNQ